MSLEEHRALAQRLEEVHKKLKGEPLEGRIVEPFGFRVKDVIEKLQQFDPEALVLTNDNEYGTDQITEIRPYTLDDWEKYLARDAGVDPVLPCVLIL